MYEATLKQFYLFESLSDAELNELLQAASVLEYTPGTVIFREGDTSDHFIIVLDGSIEIVKSMGSEIERVIKITRKNDYLGEMSLISGDQNRTASARTPDGVRVLTLPVKDFEKLLRQNAGLSYEVMRVVIRRMRETENMTISDLKDKNSQLVQSMKELQEAHEQLIEKEKMEVELATARNIQESMLPNNLPQLPGWHLTAAWQPALAVSGDFYDVVPLPDGRIALIVGDVSDRGVHAALVMTVTISMLRAAAVTAASPGALLVQVNNLLCPQIPMGMFVTCHVSFLDPQTGHVEMASAGHCRPLLRHNQQVCEIQTKGMALGIFPEMPYPDFQAQIEPGDAYLVYSDGLNESHNPSGEMYGVEAIEAVMLHAGDNMLQDLLDHMHQFTGAELDRQDDVTLIGLLRR